MSAWIVVACAFGGGAAMLAISRLRARGDERVREAVGSCAIADLEPGRFRLVGRVVPILTSRSGVDGADCVYVERAEYRAVGTGLVPLLREVDHAANAHPFYLDDGTGRLLVDPARALIECSTATADEGLTAERRVRAGEEVALVATFAPVDADREPGDGPYRAAARRWTAVADDAGPPRLSHRTEASMVRLPPDDITAFFGGAGAMMLLMGTLLAFVMAFVL